MKATLLHNFQGSDKQRAHSAPVVFKIKLKERRQSLVIAATKSSPVLR